jgi:hypothetical protein
LRNGMFGKESSKTDLSKYHKEDIKVSKDGR